MVMKQYRKSVESVGGSQKGQLFRPPKFQGSGKLKIWHILCIIVTKTYLFAAVLNTDPHIWAQGPLAIYHGFVHCCTASK